MCVDSTERIVKQEEVGAAVERTGNGHSLLLKKMTMVIIRTEVSYEDKMTELERSCWCIFRKAYCSNSLPSQSVKGQRYI